MRKILAISYQRKVTGYSKEYCFPTEMTVSYLIGEPAIMIATSIGLKQEKVSDIRKIRGGYEVEFEKGSVLVVNSKDKSIDVLYGDQQDKTN